MNTLDVLQNMHNMPEPLLLQALNGINDDIFRCDHMLNGVGPTGGDPRVLHDAKRRIYKELMRRSEVLSNGESE